MQDVLPSKSIKLMVAPGGPTIVSLDSFYNMEVVTFTKNNWPYIHLKARQNWI